MSAASLRQRGSLGCLIAVALVATACGSGSKSGAAGSSATTSAAVGATSVAATSAAGTPASTSAAPSTSAGASSAAGATTSAAASTGATQTKVKATGGGKFCKDVAAAINDASAGPSGTTPAALKAQVQKTLGEFAALVGEAPSAIKPDLQVVAAEVTKVYDAIAKANYDVTKVDPSLLQASESPQLKAASDHLDSYAKTTCGIDVSS